jgi:hypothetical protein
MTRFWKCEADRTACNRTCDAPALSVFDGCMADRPNKLEVLANQAMCEPLRRAAYVECVRMCGLRYELCLVAPGLLELSDELLRQVRKSREWVRDNRDTINNWLGLAEASIDLWFAWHALKAAKSPTGAVGALVTTAAWIGLVHAAMNEIKAGLAVYAAPPAKSPPAPRRLDDIEAQPAAHAAAAPNDPMQAALRLLAVGSVRLARELRAVGEALDTFEELAALPAPTEAQVVQAGQCLGDVRLSVARCHIAIGDISVARGRANALVSSDRTAAAADLGRFKAALHAWQRTLLPRFAGGVVANRRRARPRRSRRTRPDR